MIVYLHARRYTYEKTRIVSKKLTKSLATSNLRQKKVCSSNTTQILLIKHYTDFVHQTLHRFCSSNTTQILFIKHYTDFVHQTLHRFCSSNTTQILYPRLYFSLFTAYRTFHDDDELMNYFCRMDDRQKAISLISSRNH